MNTNEVIIVGGGLAGLTVAIALSKMNRKVLLFERNAYPHHKVCGEYVSNEVLPYLKWLGVDLYKEKGVPISQFEISTVNGRKISTKLAMGGTGISRYALDNILYKRAKELGVSVSFSKVTEINFTNDQFTVKSTEGVHAARVVVGAYGKRSALDKSLKRDFSFKKTNWLAVKAHYAFPDFPENMVALHNFKGGYGGLSKTETGAVNFCYLARYSVFKKYNDIDAFNEQVLSENPFLKKFLNESKPLFEKPLSIAQISFDQKSSVTNHVLMCGDTAGLIHPLCGNGMAMAIHSGKIASDCIQKYFQEKKFDRGLLEKEYTKQWKLTFKKRLWLGRKLQYILLSPKWVNIGVGIGGVFKGLLNYVISKTHGKPIVK